MIRVFLGLGIFWLLHGVYQYVATSDPNRLNYAMQSLLLAGVNLVVAWYLKWRRDRREGAER